MACCKKTWFVHVFPVEHGEFRAGQVTLVDLPWGNILPGCLWFNPTWLLVWTLFVLKMSASFFEGSLSVFHVCYFTVMFLPKFWLCQDLFRGGLVQPLTRVGLNPIFPASKSSFLGWFHLLKKRYGLNSFLLVQTRLKCKGLGHCDKLWQSMY